MLPTSLLKHLRELGGRCNVCNHYGPTETTIGVLVHPLLAVPSNGSRKDIDSCRLPGRKSIHTKP